MRFLKRAQPPSLPFGLLVMLASLALPAETNAQEPSAAPSGGAIVGFVSDGKGSAVHTGKAVVFLLDGKTGFPLASGARGPLDTTKAHPFQFSEYCHAVTDDSGGFRFETVPPGTYRLVAQAWAGIEGMPAGSVGVDGPEPSAILILHGVAENVEVKAGEQTLAYPRRQGDETLVLLTDPEEEHNYIVLSSNAPIGEGVLGPLGWGDRFIAGAFGITRAETPQLVVFGLAKGAHVHVGLFNYDNSPGRGGADFVVGEPGPARLPIYAGWSNGKDEPSPRLLKLTEALEVGAVDIKTLVEFEERGREQFLVYIREVWDRADEQIDVPGYGPAKFIDLLAADSYRQLRRSHANRQARTDAARSP
jgi:hypothetical protein